MRKTATIISGISATLCLSACGNNPQTLSKEGVIERQQTSSAIAVMQTESNEINVETTAMASSEDTANSNILIAYFTVPETDGADNILTERKLILKKGTIVDSTFIESPSSTKNKKQRKEA